MNRRPDTQRPEASAADEAFLAGYGHGYDIGHAHGRAEVTIEPPAEIPAPRLAGPSRPDLVDRGYIERDTARPAALPHRLWTAEDWAKASERDLPTTETGRVHWRDAIAVGHVPAELAEAFTARETDRQPAAPPAPRSATELTAAIRAAVDDTARRLAELRERLGQAELDAAYERTADRDRQRTADFSRWLEQHQADHDAGAELDADWTAVR